MPDQPIFHITTRGAWREAEAVGTYTAPSLEAEGFIHCSTRAQVVETANLFYRGQDGLVLLCIDPSMLMAPLRYEVPANTAQRPEAGRFPHVYGALNLDAVTQVVAFPSGADGSFVLPAELQNSHSMAAPMTHATQLTEETAQKLLRFIENAEPVKRLRASQLLSGAIGLVGFALVVVGIENAAQDIPIVSNAYGSIAVGLVLLLTTGLLLRKLSGGE